MLKENLKDLLEQPMDRKNFLKHIGVALVALTGISAIAGSLLGRNLGSSVVSQDGGAQGYGASAYGGEQVTTPGKSL